MKLIEGYTVMNCDLLQIWPSWWSSMRVTVISKEYRWSLKLDYSTYWRPMFCWKCASYGAWENIQHTIVNSCVLLGSSQLVIKNSDRSILGKPVDTPENVKWCICVSDHNRCHSVEYCCIVSKWIICCFRLNSWVDRFGSRSPYVDLYNGMAIFDHKIMST